MNWLKSHLLNQSKLQRNSVSKLIRSYNIRVHCKMTLKPAQKKPVFFAIQLKHHIFTALKVGVVSEPYTYRRHQIRLLASFLLPAANINNVFLLIHCIKTPILWSLVLL
jgi:hypothetical protein